VYRTVEMERARIGNTRSLFCCKAYLPPDGSDEHIASVGDEIADLHPGATQKEFGGRS